MIHGRISSVLLGILCLACVGDAFRQKASAGGKLDDFDQVDQETEIVHTALTMIGENPSLVQKVQAEDIPTHRSQTSTFTRSADANFWLNGHRLFISSATVIMICFVCYVMVNVVSNCFSNSASQEYSQKDENESMITQAPFNQTIATSAIVIGAFVCTEVGRTLLTFDSLGSGSHLPYEPSAVVLLAEVVKLVVATGFILMQKRSTTWRDSMRVFWPQCGVAGLFAMQNTLNIYAIAFVGPALFGLLGQCKIIFTCYFMWLMLGKQFSACKQVAVFLLVLAVMLPQFANRSSPASSTSDELIFSLGVVLVFVAGICSGLSAVMNEQILKDDTFEVPFMVKNAMLYVWGIVFNFSALAWKSTSKWFDGFGLEAFSVTLLLAGTGLSIAWILKYMDNVVRCFASVSTVFLTTICSVFLFGDSLNIWVVCGVIIFCCAIILYSYEPGIDLKTLKVQGTVSAFIVLMTLSLWFISQARDIGFYERNEHEFTPGVARDILGSHEYYQGRWLGYLRTNLIALEKDLSTPGASNDVFRPPEEDSRFISTEKPVTTEKLKADFWYVRRMYELELADKIMPASSTGRLAPPDWKDEVGKHPEEFYSKPGTCTSCFDVPPAEGDVDIGTNKQLMMDEWALDRWENVHFAQFPPSKVHETSISNADNPPLQQKFFGNVLSVGFDDTSGTYKIWLQTGPDTYSVYESNDMLGWKNKTKVALNTTTLCVMIDQNDPDQNHRYKAVYECEHFDPKPDEWQNHTGGMKTCLATSPDGVHFSKLLGGHTALPSHGQGMGFAADSTSCLAWDSKRQAYSLTNRAQYATHKAYRWRDIRGLRHLQLKGLLRNETAALWDVDLEYYFDKDHGDLERFRRVIYGFSQFEHEGLYFGIATVLEYPRCLIDLGCQHCKRRTYITTSRDGVHYDSRWIYSDAPLKLPKFNSTSCPTGVCQYQAANRMIMRGKSMLLPFIAMAPPHNPGHYTFDLWSNLTSTPNEVHNVHIAEWQQDRIVGLSVSNASEGLVVTKPFKLEGRELWVNSKVMTGSLTVTIRKAGKDNIILKRSEVIKDVDEIYHRVRWESDATGTSSSLGDFLNSRVTLSFELRGDATLFSFQFLEDGTAQRQREQRKPRRTDLLSAHHQHL